MPGRLLRGCGLAAVLVASAFAGCGDASDSPFGRGYSNGSGGGGDGSDASGQGTGAAPNINTEGGTTEDAAPCAETTEAAERTPLDLFLMVDVSGSMLQPASGAATKWDAVKSALIDFVTDTQSAGIGVGIQYFPQLYGCSTHEECGTNGPCLISTCECRPTPTRPDCYLEPCTSSAECRAGSSCIALGRCSTLLDTYCPYPGTYLDCGECLEITNSVCARSKCLVEDYWDPAVDIGELPGAASALVNSINGVMIEGQTPTGPALSGAIERARAHALANPGRTVAVLLATDGFPTECFPPTIDPLTDVIGIAADGFADEPSIRTFVIAVFSPSELMDLGLTPAQAKNRMDSLAASGGTTESFVVSTQQNVTDEFVLALNAIRHTALGCEYQIPAPDAGETLDLFKVNVEVTNSLGEQTKLFYVQTPLGCLAVEEGGWYYDVDPETGGVPTKIKVCGQNCDQFTNGTYQEIHFELGCQTILPPIR